MWSNNHLLFSCVWLMRPYFWLIPIKQCYLVVLWNMMCWLKIYCIWCSKSSPKIPLFIGVKSRKCSNSCLVTRIDFTFMRSDLHACIIFYSLNALSITWLAICGYLQSFGIIATWCFFMLGFLENLSSFNPNVFCSFP
jgi:hypothetical protein